MEEVKKVFTLSEVASNFSAVVAPHGTGTGRGKVTTGLASHWPCVTDFSGLSTYGLTA